MSILFQLMYKDKTDTKLLTNYIEHCQLEEEFFIRKAIGWALRDHARTQPEAVRTFLIEHASQLSGLTRREAGKHLG